MAYSGPEDYIYSIEQIHIKQLNPQVLLVKWSPEWNTLTYKYKSSNTSKNLKWNTDLLDPSTSSEENAIREEKGVSLSFTPPQSIPSFF